MEAEMISGWARSTEEVWAWCSLTEAPVSPDEVVGWASDPMASAYVLRDHRRPVAYGEIGIDHDEREVEIGHLIVDPDLRNRGSGRALAAALLTVGRDHYPEVFLRVHTENGAALRCYRAAGFVRVAEAQEAAWNRTQPNIYVWMVAT